MALLSSRDSAGSRKASRFFVRFAVLGVAGTLACSKGQELQGTLSPDASIFGNDGFGGQGNFGTGGDTSGAGGFTGSGGGLTFTGSGGLSFGGAGGAATGGTGSDGLDASAGGLSFGGAGGLSFGGAGGLSFGGAGGLSFGGAGSGGHSSGGAGTGGVGTGGAGTGGNNGAGGEVIDDGGVCGSQPVTTATGFVNLAPPMGAPLDGKGTTLSPAAPTGWTWYQIDGAVCRDGSPTGFYVRPGTVNKLLIYLEGGGACSSPGFCTYNPMNVNQVLNGNGQTVATSIGGAVAGRQQPGTDGIFNMTQTANPFKDWTEIYVPYCTGDVHFGTVHDGIIPNIASQPSQPAKQQFVGYLNMKLFIGRIVPTFKDKVSRVVLTGASAGGFGAALNFSMVQDAFGCVPVTALDDSGPPFDDQYMPACMQKKWRTIWGFASSLPSDCTECQQTDGGGMVHLAEFLMRKHPNATIGMVSSMQDEVIRLFYSSGLKGCSTFDVADPTGITLGQLDPTVYMTGAVYTSGLNALRTEYVGTGKFATYYLGGANITFHQHIWRPEFYDASAGTKTEAAWTSDFLAGKMEQIGP